MKTNETIIFESMPVPKAIAKTAIPTVRICLRPQFARPISWQIVQGVSTLAERRASESEGFDQEICVSFSG